MGRKSEFPISLSLIKTDQPQCFRCETHSDGLLKRLQARRDLSDVVLIAGESSKRISAHRLILMASSDYFSDLLSESKGESKVVEITLNDVDGEALEKLVNFCYTGSLELTMDTIKTMFITANYLKLKEITEGYSEFLLRHLQPSNCLTVAFFAEELNLETLQHDIKKFIGEHFQEVSQHPEFLLLNAKQLSEFIASDDLDVPSEEFVFQLLIKWIEYEPENRRNHFTELLAQVRLPLLSTAFLMEKVEPLCNTMESQKLVMNAVKSQILLTSNFTQPRNYSSKSVVNQLWAISVQKTTQQNKNLAIAGYNLRTSLWTIWDTPIEFRSGFAVALMGEDLIVVGGTTNDIPINTVTKLNVYAMVSSELAPLKTSRTNHALAVLNGAIYAIGGYNGRKILNSVERWDPVNRTWNFIPVMDNARQDPAVAVFNDRLYVSGGVCGINVLTSVEFYDPVLNTWRSTAPMKEKRHSHCLAAYKGYLFAFGGYYGAGKCVHGKSIGNINITSERYDPRTNTWTEISLSPRMSLFTKCASLGNQLFIYNYLNSGFYTVSGEGSCDNLKLQTVNKAADTFTIYECNELIAIPFKFSPPGSSIRNKEF